MIGLVLLVSSQSGHAINLGGLVNKGFEALGDRLRKQQTKSFAEACFATPYLRSNNFLFLHDSEIAHSPEAGLVQVIAIGVAPDSSLHAILCNVYQPAHGQPIMLSQFMNNRLVWANPRNR